MPVRYPPENQNPRTSNRDPRKPRVVSYVETGPGFFRRLMRRLFSAPVIIPVVFISAIVLGVLIYYWTVFSGRIDNPNVRTWQVTLNVLRNAFIQAIRPGLDPANNQPRDGGGDEKKGD